MSRVAMSPRAVYVAIAIAALALALAVVSLVYRPAPTQTQASAPQIAVTYELNIPQNLTLTGNIALSPYYPVLSGQQPLLWFNATVSNGGTAVVKVVVYVGDRSIVAGIYRVPVTNQPVYVDLTPYIQGTGRVDVKIDFIAEV